jgi:metal-responsive CopG/Arc/MetJ family transcriptional regulator
MPRSAAKIAVSVPADLFRALESARRRSGRSRSALVQEALRDWLRRQARGELVREYEAGYRSHPEAADEIERALATAAPLLSADADDW